VKGWEEVKGGEKRRKTFPCHFALHRASFPLNLRRVDGRQPLS
jgi:hypothetical protein